LKDYVPDMVPIAILSTLLYWLVYSHRSNALGKSSMLIHGAFAMLLAFLPFMASAVEDKRLRT